MPHQKYSFFDEWTSRSDVDLLRSLNINLDNFPPQHMGMFVFGLAAYNLVRMRNLAAQSV